MNRAGDDFFARARFARDQNGHVAFGDNRQFIDFAQKSRISADNLFKSDFFFRTGQKCFAFGESIRVNAVFEKVVENVQRLFRRRKERGSKVPHIILRMIRMKETEPHVAEFEHFWKPWLEEGDEIVFSTYQTWNNTVEDRRIDDPAGLSAVANLEKKPPCRMIYKTMQIYYDGRTTPCCYDYDCTMEIGNAKKESIAEMWNGERAQHFRRMHEEGRMAEIPICRNCQEYIP